MSVLKLAPNFGQKSEVLFKLAVIFGKTYQLDQAINYFKLAMLESTGTAGANRRLDIQTKMGICYLEKKEYGEALKCFEVALSISDQNFHSFQHIAWCEFLMEKYTQALEHINKAIALKDSDGDGYYIKGRILLATTKYSEAKEAFNRALVINPNKAVYLGSLGILNCLTKSDPEAFENFLKATQLDSNIAETWFNIGLLYEAHEQSTEASIAYQKALEVVPDFTPAYSRKEAIAAPPTARSSLPQFIFPEFRVFDVMVPLKSYLNNPKIKKALEPSMMQTGQPTTMMRNIFSDSSLPPPEDNLRLTPAAVRVNEDDKERLAETKAREEKKQPVKEKKKENVEEHREIPLPVTTQPEKPEPKHEQKPPSLEPTKEHHPSKVTQPGAMAAPQATYLAVPKAIRPVPSSSSSQPQMPSQPTVPAQVPSMHPSAPTQIPIPQQPTPNQFDTTSQYQYNVQAQPPSISGSMGSMQQIQQMAQLAQMALGQLQQMPTGQSMGQSSQIPQGQPMSQMPPTGFPSNPHSAQAQYMNFLGQLMQLSQQPQFQSQLQNLMNYFGMMNQLSNTYMPPSYHQNYMMPSKNPYPQNVAFGSSAPSMPRPVQQVPNEPQPSYQYSSMPRGSMPSGYGIPNFSQIHRPDTASGVPSMPMNLARPSYQPTDQPHQYAHQEIPQVSPHIQDQVDQTPIMPTRPIPQHPRVVPGLRPPTVKQPIRVPGRQNALDDLMKVAGVDNKGIRPQGFQRAGQEYYGQEYEDKREDCGNVVKLSMSPQKIEGEYYGKRRQPEADIGREGMGNYDQANLGKRYKGDQNE